MYIEAKTVQDKLIFATIEVIEKEGIQAVTIRKVAQVADVNSAAINYYFGSKERLLEEALKHTMNHAFADMLEELEEKSTDPYVALQAFFLYLLEGGILHSGLTKVHFYEPFIHNNYNGLFLSWFNSVLDELLQKMKSLLPNKSEEEIRFSIVQMVAAIMFPCLLPGVFGEFSGKGFEDAETRAKYVEYLVKQHVKLADK